MLDQSILLFFSALLLMAAWSDYRQYTIPNAIPITLILLWPIAAIVFSIGWWSAVTALLVASLVMGFAILLWLPGWIGGGDGKLLAATALWFGLTDTLDFLLYVVLAGGVLSVALMIARRLKPAESNSDETAQAQVLEKGQAAPYAIAIAAGALIALPSSHLMA